MSAKKYALYSGTKRCRSCKKDLPVEQFRLHAYRDSVKRPGEKLLHRHSYCTDCVRERSYASSGKGNAEERALGGIISGKHGERQARIYGSKEAFLALRNGSTEYNGEPICRVCTWCGERKPVTEFGKSAKSGRILPTPHCLECSRNDGVKRQRAKPAEYHRAVSNRYRKNNYARVLESRRAQRSAWIASGLNNAGKPRALRGRGNKGWPRTGFDVDEAIWDKLAEQNAKQAWSWFLKNKASDEWMRRYYAAQAKPWNNPRLTDAQAYALRYSIDTTFAQRERERVTERRFKNPAYATQWARHNQRWYRALSSSDGSIDRDTLRYLRSIPECAYCGVNIPADDRHLDHVTPIAKGGRHSEDNLIPACGKCNRRKSDRSLLSFVFPRLWVLPNKVDLGRVIQPTLQNPYRDLGVAPTNG